MAGVDDDCSLAEDMMNVEVLLGHDVVRIIEDNHILALLRAYSADKDRVQKVVNDLQRTHRHEDDLAMYMDADDDDVLLALDSPYLNQSRLNLVDRSPAAQSAPVLNNELTTTASSADVTSSSTSTHASPHSEISMKEPVLQPAKFNVDAEGDGSFMTVLPIVDNPLTSSGSKEEPTSGSFSNHRHAGPNPASDDSSSSDPGSEPEVISIHEEDRKRRKQYGSKSPGKKTKVEVVDLVSTSPNNILDSNEYFGIIQAMFPYTDPDFLRAKFKNVEDEQELNVVAAALLESNEYLHIMAGNKNLVELEKPSTSSNHNSSSVILKPSVFEVQDTNDPRPSTSSSITGKTDHEEGPSKRMDNREQYHLNLSEGLVAHDAMMDAPNSATVLQSDGISVKPHSTGATVLPQPAVNITASVGQIALKPSVAEIEVIPSSSTVDVPGPLVSCTQSVVPNPNQAFSSLPPEFRDISIQQDILAFCMPDPEQADSVPKKTAVSSLSSPEFSDNSFQQDILILSDSPKTVQLPVLTGNRRLSTESNNSLHVNVGWNPDTVGNATGPGGSNNGYTKEEPWAEKYSLLLCLLPQSHPKYLEEKARELYDKPEEFNLFVETSLEEPPNPSPIVVQRGNIEVTPAVPTVHAYSSPKLSVTTTRPVGTHDVKVSVSAPSATVTSANLTDPHNPKGAKASGQSAANVLGPSSANTPASSSVNIPGPSNAKTSISSSTKTSESTLVSIPGTSRMDLPGPSGVTSSVVSKTNLPGPSGANLPGSSGVDQVAAGPSGLGNSEGGPNPWFEQHQFFLSILPDADPSYLEEKAKLLYDKDEELKTFVANALENKDYPTLKDFQRRQELIALQNKYLKDFNIENFLDIVPEPFKYFSQSTRKPTVDTQGRGLLFLKRKYRLIRSMDITKIYQKNNYNLTNTCHELDVFKGNPLKSRRPDFQIWDKSPDLTLSLQFLQEVAFIENEDKIKKYLKDKEDEEKQALQEAREKGELLECNCCFDDEVLARNIVACPEGHVFCKDCVRKGAETKIGEGVTKVSCLTDCQAEFTLQSLQGVLKPTVFSKLAQRKQLEEIKAAGIEDVVQCPFCDFCNIPGAGDRIFRCLNPDCMKNSCISCKEESHIPLRCDEVEKATEVKMRTYIEDKMTEALVRTCWKCQRKFVKIDGCNKMTCQCGALMCYICRQPVRDYSHFNGQGGEEFHKCPLFSDNNDLHVDAVEKVAREAKAELAQKHPGLNLRHDPTAVPIPREPGRRQDYDDDDDYDVDDSDESLDDFDEDIYYMNRRWRFKYDDYYGEEEEEEEEEEENEEEEDEEGDEKDDGEEEEDEEEAGEGGEI